MHHNFWYETAPQCIKAIHDVREVAPFLKDGILGELRDVSDWHIVLALSKTEAFWQWVGCFQVFLGKAEAFRLWGNGCPCHEADLMKGKAVVCDKLSRRLPEAFDFVEKFLGSLATWVNSLTLADCHNDPNIFEELTFVTRRFIPEVRAKFGFVGIAPYVVCNITQPRFASMFLELYHGAGRQDQHRVTLSIADAFLPDIVKIAGGDVTSIPQGLKSEELVFKNIPLSSSRAEGYHRTTRLSKIRGSASSIPWILSSSRIVQNLELIEAITDESELGVLCFSAEYRSFSRILQSKPGCQFL